VFGFLSFSLLWLVGLSCWYWFRVGMGLLVVVLAVVTVRYGYRLVGSRSVVVFVVMCWLVWWFWFGWVGFWVIGFPAVVWTTW